MWITKLARLQPPRLNDHSLQVHLETCSITASEFITQFTQPSLSYALPIALKHRLQPVQIYCVLMGSYIDTEMRIQTEYMSFKYR
jgi:hypothetical protein